MIQINSNLVYWLFKFTYIVSEMYHDLNIFSKNISIVVVVNLTPQVLLFNRV